VTPISLNPVRHHCHQTRVKRSQQCWVNAKKGSHRVALRTNGEIAPVRTACHVSPTMGLDRI
jgi:hypothetical protein